MKKVLIVDDEPALRLLLTATLEDEGYQLFEAADGIRAWQLAQQERPDLIVLDVMMPGMTGYEVCAKVKADSELQGTIVVMLTAKGQAADRAQSLNSGADCYIRKPFSPLALAEKVATLLGASQQGA